MRREALTTISRLLSVDMGKWHESELPTLNAFAVALTLIPDLDKWTDIEKQELVKIIKAKCSADEAEYLKLMQRHDRFRSAAIALGIASS
jgi:hypothetical protein